jgi:hypothetical protein
MTIKKTNAFLGRDDHGFRREMAKEPLVHNPAITDANEALSLAQELIIMSVAWEESVKSVELEEPEEEFETVHNHQADNGL